MDKLENKIKQPDIKDELAKERTHEAHERTMMAWVRTSLTLIGFGVGIFEFASKAEGRTIFRSSELVGISMIVLGVVSMVLAIRENRNSHKRLINPDYKYLNKTSLGIRIGYALIVIGIVALINVIIKIINYNV